MNAKVAFEKIAGRLIDRIKDIQQFAITEYSFEEWINWEAYLACREVQPPSAIQPKPNYRKEFLVDTGQAAADLLIKNEDGSRIVVEVALVHDGTKAGKWQIKIDNDQIKLSRVPTENAIKLQIVIILSMKGPVLGNHHWEMRLRRTTLFSRNDADPPFQRGVDLEGSGQLVVFGWAS